MAENFGIGPGPHELKIGSSFTGGRGGSKFQTIRTCRSHVFKNPEFSMFNLFAFLRKIFFSEKVTVSIFEGLSSKPSGKLIVVPNFCLWGPLSACVHIYHVI